jgi:hypothetical protein
MSHAQPFSSRPLACGVQVQLLLPAVVLSAPNDDSPLGASPIWGIAIRPRPSMHLASTLSMTATLRPNPCGNLGGSDATLSQVKTLAPLLWCSDLS